MKNKGLVNSLISKVGKRNYEKLRRLKYDEYHELMSGQQLVDLIKRTEDSKANIYKGHKIDIEVANKFKGKKRVAQTRATQDELDIPKVKLYYDLFYYPEIQSKLSIGHELGHAKQIIDIKNLQIKLEQLKQKPNTNPRIINKLNDLIEKKKSQYYINTEIKADKNIPNYLKSIGIPKRERQAHLYYRKFINPNSDGRYTSKFGNLKYLKDYLFGFSNLSQDVLERAWNRFEYNFSCYGYDYYKDKLQKLGYMLKYYRG